MFIDTPPPKRPWRDALKFALTASVVMFVLMLALGEGQKRQAERLSIVMEKSK